MREGSFRLASLVVIGKSMFVGTNHYKTHPELLMEDKHSGEHYSSHHAEMDALLKAKRALGTSFDRHVKKMKLFVLRVDRRGNITMAKPCRHCERKLMNAGLLRKNIYFTNYNGEWETMNDAHDGRSIKRK